MARGRVTLASARLSRCTMTVPPRLPAVYTCPVSYLAPLSRRSPMSIPSRVLGTGEFEVEIERGVPVPMRDGTVLRADVYRPAANGRFPVLVERVGYELGARVRARALPRRRLGHTPGRLRHRGMGCRAAMVKRQRRHAGWLVLRLHPVPRGAHATTALARALAARRRRRPLPRLGLPRWCQPVVLHPLVDAADVPGMAVAPGRGGEGPGGAR